MQKMSPPMISKQGKASLQTLKDAKELEELMTAYVLDKPYINKIIKRIQVRCQRNAR